MRKINFMMLLLVLMAMSSCKSDNDSPVGYQQVSGEWYYELAESGQCYDIRQGDQLVEVTYDHLGILVSLGSGTGTWTHYYLKDGELVNYDGRFDEALFSYTVDKDANLFFLSELEDEDRSTPLDAFGLHYVSASDVIQSVPFDGTTMTFRRLTKKQKEKMAKWDHIIDSDHVGFANSDYNTDLDPNHATEPSRAPKR